jgi:hypothetical protein
MFERTKQHLKDHKEEYIVGGVCLVVGCVAGVALANNAEVIQIVDAFKVQICSPTTNIVIAALGDPGNVVQSLTTKEVWASQAAAARALGVSPAQVAQHLSGKNAHVAGHTLKVLGKAGFPVEPIAA